MMLWPPIDIAETSLKAIIPLQVLALDAATGYMVLSERLAAQNILLVRKPNSNVE